MITVQIVEHGRTTTVEIRPGQPAVSTPVRAPRPQLAAPPVSARPSRRAADAAPGVAR